MWTRPRALAVAALLLLAGLVALMPKTPPIIEPADAVAYEGRTVTMFGIADDVRIYDDAVRFTIVADGYGVPVHAPGGTVSEGAFMEVLGRLVRLGGTLTFIVEQADDVQMAWQGGAAPSVAQIAHDPASWEHRPLQLTGTLADDFLVGDRGHRLRLGHGTWFEGGATVHGSIAYDDRCLCYVLHGQEVQPWSQPVG